MPNSESSPPKFVRLHDAGLHELRAQPVQRQHNLLSLGLDGNEAHAGLLARRPDRLTAQNHRPALPPSDIATGFHTSRNCKVTLQHRFPHASDQSHDPFPA